MFGVGFSTAPFASFPVGVETGLCGPLGKNTTCAEIEDQIRQDLKVSESVPSQVFLDLINQSCDELKEKLGIRGLYLCFENLGIGASFNLASIKMGGVAKVVDSVNGLVVMLSPEEFERDFALYDNSVTGTHEGETLTLSYGGNLTPGRIRLYYYRHIVPATSRSAKPDIPDRYTSLLIERVKHAFS